MKNLMTIEERKALGYRLKAARKEKGLSQEELANIVGVKVGTISKYEQGDRIPSFARIFDLAEALGCDSTVFMPTGEDVYRLAKTSAHEFSMDEYAAWLTSLLYDCRPARATDDFGNTIDIYTFKIGDDKYSITSENLGKVMLFQKEQFAQIVKHFSELLR